MKRVKSTLAIVLTLCLLLGMFPVTALAATEAGIVVTPIDGKEYTSAGGEAKTIYGLKFSATVPGGIQRMVTLLSFDSTKIQAVRLVGNKYADLTTTADGSTDTRCFELTGVAQIDELEGNILYDTVIGSWKTVGDRLTVDYTVTHQTTVANTVDTQGMYNFYYRLKDDVKLSDLTAGSIQIVTDPTSDVYKAHYNVDVDGTGMGLYLGSIDGTKYNYDAGTASLSLTHPGSANKDDYTGTQADQPEVATKKGGSVTLTANPAIDGEKVEYAYSTSAAPTASTAWQTATEFTNLPLGEVYFFARVQETDLHKAGEVKVLGPVTIYGVPSVDGVAVTGEINKAITPVTLQVTGNNVGGTFAMTGTLPAGLTFDDDTGVISGTPTAGGKGSVTVVYTDAEGQTSAPATITYDISKMAVTGLTFAPAAVDYDGADHQVTVTGKPGMGEITVKYDGKTTLPKDAGTYAVTVDVAASDLYNGVTALYLGDFVINPKTLTAADLEYTGDAITKTYDGTTDCNITTGVAVKAGSLAAGDKLELTIARAVYDSEDVATPDNQVTFTVNPVTAGNYRLADGTTLTRPASITPADYTPNVSEKQNVVVNVGTFTEPAFPGVNDETVTGTLTYTYNEESKSKDEIVTALKGLAKGETATIGWSFTATDSNYVDGAKTGEIAVTMVDIIFQMGEDAATAENAVTIKTAPTYGDTWAQIVTIKEGIKASVDGREVAGTYALNVTGSPVSGTQSYKVLFTATGADAEKYTNVEVLSGSVEVAKKAITVTANNQTKVYGKDNPELTWTVKADDLEGEDTKDMLTVELSCAADENSPVGTPVAITGTGSADHYLVTVEPGVMTITKATIAQVDWTAVGTTIYANDAKNSDEGLNTVLSLPDKVQVTLDSGKTEEVPVSWTGHKEAYAPKGGAYTFEGTLTTGNNINAYSTKLTDTVTVKPVTGAISKVNGEAATALVSPVTVAKAKAEAAAAYTDFKLPGSIELTFTADGTTVAPASYEELTWSVSLDALKGKGVNSTTDVAITSIPAWVTIDASALTVQVKITDKYPVNVTVTQSGTTYGTPLAAPVATQVADEDGTDDTGSATWTYLYKGTTAAGRTYSSAAAPTEAGTYTVTVTLVSDTHAGSGTSAEFVIEPKAISGATVELPAEYAPVYSGSAFTPAVTVKDGETVLKANTDYTVAYSDNTNAGEATVTITGKGNYKDSAAAHFTIAKAQLAEKKPTITGTAQVGKVLSADLAGIPVDQYTWKWFRGGVEIPGATASSYLLLQADSNKAITVQAIAKEVNYTGTTLASEATAVAKQTITGTVTIGANAAPIAAGTELTANAVITPDVAVTYQWFVNGEAVVDAVNETFMVPDDAADAQITVTVTAAGDFDGAVTSAPVTVGKSVLTGTVEVAQAGENITATLTGELSEDNCDIVWLRDGEEIPGATGTTYTLTEEDKGCTITAKAVAKGDDYVGEVISANEVSVAAEAPAAPVVSASAGNGQVTVRWSAPADHGAPITGYTVQVVGGASVSVSAATTNYTFTGLTNGTEYTFQVTAINGMGSSAAGEVKATPKTSSGGGGGISTYTLTFETNGGVRISSVSKSAGSKIDLADYQPTKEGYVFAGWYSDKELTKKVTSVTLNKNTTVYAKWTEEGAVSELPFTDVEMGDWFYDAVAFAFEEGLMKGIEDTTFAPTMTTTRSMVVTILWRMEGSPVVNYAMDFNDVDPASWYGEAVRWAAAEKVVNGVGDNLFAPDQAISREQMATMLYRYAQYLKLDTSAKGDLSKFVDGEQVSSWADEAMQWAVGTGLFTGKDGNRLDPTGNASRAEVATLFQRLAEFTEAN